MTSTAPARSGTVTLAFAREVMALCRVGALCTAGDTGDRTRGLGAGGFLTIAAKDLAGPDPGADLDGAIAAFDHELPTDQVEAALALRFRNIFLAVGLAETGAHEPLQLLGRGVGTGRGYDSSLLVGG